MKLHLSFRPRALVIPLATAFEYCFEGDPLTDFVRRRIERGDVGPLEIIEGVASTPEWDLEIARTVLCVVLRKKSGLAVTPGRDE